ncbi:MAG: hypothetical protein Kow0099_36190 [Candidatus Abyssubacteria bacterium]
MITRIDHVSLAVRDYERAKEFVQRVFGGTSVAAMEDSALHYFWDIFTLGDMSRLELITPTGEESFLKNFLRDRAGGAHHITMETADIHKFKEHLDEQGVPYFGFSVYPELWSELFIHPRDAFGVLIQIFEAGPQYHTVEPVKRAQGKRWKIKRDGDGYELSLHHPGGTELKLSMSKKEMEELAKDLQEALAGSE